MCGACQNIEFIRTRDGEAAALAYAQQMATRYRIAVRQTKGLVARPLLIQAYKCARQYEARARKAA